MKAQILIRYEVIRETEKAMLINTPCAYHDGYDKPFEMWVPKSQVKVMDNGLAVATWLIDKTQMDMLKYGFTFRALDYDNVITC